MAENYEFDQNQDQDDHIDTNFHPEQQEEFEADPKDEEKPPSRNGFLPKLVLDPKVDPNADLIKVMLNNTLHGHDDSESWLYESIYSLYACLAFETLAQEYQRIATNDACMLLAVRFSDVMQTAHTRTYFQSKFIDFLPDRVIPEQVLQKLADLSNSKLIKKFNTLSSQQVNKNEDEKQSQIKLANLGQKVHKFQYVT